MMSKSYNDKVLDLKQKCLDNLYKSVSTLIDDFLLTEDQGNNLYIKADELVSETLEYDIETYKEVVKYVEVWKNESIKLTKDEYLEFFETDLEYVNETIIDTLSDYLVGEEDNMGGKYENL